MSCGCIAGNDGDGSYKCVVILVLDVLIQRLQFSYFEFPCELEHRVSICVCVCIIPIRVFLLCFSASP